MENYNKFFDSLTEKDEKLFFNLLLLTKPEIVQIRGANKHLWVKAILSLYSEEKEFTTSDLQKEIIKSFGIELKRGVITECLEDLVKKKDIEYIESKNYKIVQKIIVEDYRSYQKKIWTELSQILNDSITDYDNFYDEKIQILVDEIFLRYLIQINKDLEELENHQIEKLPETDTNLNSIIDICINESSLQENIAAKVPTIIKNYLSNKSSVANDFIAQCYTGAILLYVLMKETKLPQIVLKDQIHCLIIDTDFLVHLLCTTSSKHGICDVVMRNCIKSKIPVYYLDKTKKELNSLIQSTKFKDDDENQQKIYRNQILLDFINKQKRDSSLVWGRHHHYLSTWTTELKDKYEIIKFPDSFHFVIDEKFNAKIKNGIDLIEKTIFKKEGDTTGPLKAKNKLQIAHDVYCMSALNSIKERYLLEHHPNGKNLNFVGPFFLTFDNTLALVDQLYAFNENYRNLVIQPRALLNFMITFSGIKFNRVEKTDLGRALLNYSLTDINIKISIDDFAKTLLRQRKVADEREQDFILNCIFSSTLKDGVEKMLESGDITQAESEVRQNLPLLNEHLEKHTALEDRVKELSHNLKEEKDKNKKIEAKIEKNELIIASYKTQIDNLNDILKNNNVNLNVALDNKVFINQDDSYLFNKLISVLKEENAFEKANIPPVPTTQNKKSISNWLTNAKKCIDNYNSVAGAGLKTLNWASMTIPLLITSICA